MNFKIDTSQKGKKLTSLFNNLNKWTFNLSKKTEEYDDYELADYIQLMQCSGGNKDRDLFKDPFDRTVLDDYDFSRLVAACHNVLELGAKPMLKFGNVPMKYSVAPEKCTANYGAFKMNVYPPEDYNVYYNYIRAIVQTLADEFGKEEMLSWRYGVMTELENGGWFMDPSGDPEKTKIAYFKLYDYTVQALIDVLGNDVFVGAHTMACSPGLWDVTEFIKHAAQGTNCANGGKGSKICFLAASWYHTKPGQSQPAHRYTYIKTMSIIMDAAKKYGLNDLIYGVDEGRILYGSTKGVLKSDLSTRTVGYTYQAAFDAKLYKESMDMGISYFSVWSLSKTDSKGNTFPTMAYYIAKNTSEFDGMDRASVLSEVENIDPENHTSVVAGVDEANRVVRIMAYNYVETIGETPKVPLTLNIDMPVSSGNAKIVTKYINDDCNYFDEWLEDRKKYNIGDDKFDWSPDDPAIYSCFKYMDESFKETYYNELAPKYKEAARLVPKESAVQFNDGKLVLEDIIDGNSAVFYEIKY